MDDHPRAPVTDRVIAVALLALSWLSLFVAHDVGAEEARSLIEPWVEYVLVAAMVIPLAWRRVRPLTVLAVVTPVALLIWGVEVPDQLGPTAATWLPRGCSVTPHAPGSQTSASSHAVRSCSRRNRRSSPAVLCSTNVYGSPASCTMWSPTTSP